MRWNRPKDQDLGSGSRQAGRGLGNMVLMTVEVGDLSRGVGLGSVKIQLGGFRLLFGWWKVH